MERPDSRVPIDVSAGKSASILSCTDAFDVAEYAATVMQCACGAGIITGSGFTLAPQGTAIRAQLAVMLYRWLAWAKAFCGAGRRADPRRAERHRICATVNKTENLREGQRRKSWAK